PYQRLAEKPDRFIRLKFRLTKDKRRFLYSEYIMSCCPSIRVLNQRQIYIPIGNPRTSSCARNGSASPGLGIGLRHDLAAALLTRS
ncbi:MAG: hypothetical protein OXL96_11820, partial [Candidatus Poribacteria bacterium]|nr:hypothetical protein [Candidatus Poribacteria bacterium]